MFSLLTDLLDLTCASVLLLLGGILQSSPCLASSPSPSLWSLLMWQTLRKSMRGAQRMAWWENGIGDKNCYLWPSCFLLITFFLLVLPGVCYLCSQPGYQSSHRSLSISGLRWHVGGNLGHCHRPARHLLHPGGRPGVAAGENEAGVMGSTNLLGTGRSLCCEYNTIKSRLTEM